MISIIISSYQPQYYDALVENIKNTIGNGIIYEIIQIWNPNLMSIAKAYNSGAEESKYENLLFLHEDVLFNTKNWGEKLVKHLQKTKTGILGIAGSSYVPYAPSSWTVSPEYNVIHIIQADKKSICKTLESSTEKNRTRVFALDGVFMAIRKEVFKQFRFQEDLPGFHGYDLDFSLRVCKIFHNYVINDILITHFSKGSPDKKWLDANILIRKNLGSDFNRQKNGKVETNCFLGFMHIFFEYYPISCKTIFTTFRFYPKNLSIKNNFKIIKRYLNYIRFSKCKNYKLNNKSK